MFFFIVYYVMNHYIKDDIYYIEQDDKIILKISLNCELNQVIIETPREVYSGPLEFLHFKEE